MSDTTTTTAPRATRRATTTTEGTDLVVAPSAPPPPHDDRPRASGGPFELPADPATMIGLGGARFTQKQTDVLMAPARDEELDVLPTGEIYGGAVHVRRRLNAAFGPGGWGLRPLAEPRIMGNTLAQHWGLVVGKRWVAMAYGEADYYEKNARTSWATTMESLKSNALTRLCKDIGVLSECWDRRFGDKWRASNCVKVYREHTPKDAQREGERWQWRRRDAPPFWDERKTGNPTDRDQARHAATNHDDSSAGLDVPRGTTGGAASAPTAQGLVLRTITEAERARLFDLCRAHDVTNEAMRAHLVKLKVTPRQGQEFPTTRELPARLYDAVCAWAMRGGK